MTTTRIPSVPLPVAAVDTERPGVSLHEGNDDWTRKDTGIVLSSSAWSLAGWVGWGRLNTRIHYRRGCWGVVVS